MGQDSRFKKKTIISSGLFLFSNQIEISLFLFISLFLSIYIKSGSSVKYKFTLINTKFV